MKLAIVGSRNYDDYESFSNAMNHILSKLKFKVSLIISGGCRGTDKMSERYADEHLIEKKIFEANWALYGKKAGILRNNCIANECDMLVAFVMKDSIGTRNTISLVKNLDKSYITFEVS